MPMKKNLNNIELTYMSLDDYMNYFYGNDIDVSAVLVCKGYELVDIAPVSSTKATFIFRNHPSITEIVDGFWSNRIEVRPLEFANARKNLKSRIYGMIKY